MRYGSWITVGDASLPDVSLAAWRIGSFAESAPAVVGTFAGKMLDPRTLQGFYANGLVTLPTVNARVGSFGDVDHV